MNLKEKISLKEFGILASGMFFVSASVYYIMMPGEFVVGAVSGLVIVIQNFIPLNISTLTLILNVGLLIIGFVFVGQEFGIKTVITSLMLPAYLKLFEVLTPDVPVPAEDMLVNVICFVIIMSLGQAMLFNANASSGGLDIVAKLLNKYLHMELGKALSIAGFAVAASSIFVYDRNTLIISLLATYFNGKAIDSFIDGFHTRKNVSIISPEYEKIQDFVLHELNRGVTLFPAYGGWKHEPKTELVTILQINEYAQLLEFVNRTDPKAFLTVSSVGQVIGQWNPHRRNVDCSGTGKCDKK